MGLSGELPGKYILTTPFSHLGKCRKLPFYSNGIRQRAIISRIFRELCMKDCSFTRYEDRETHHRITKIESQSSNSILNELYITFLSSTEVGNLLICRGLDLNIYKLC